MKKLRMLTTALAFSVAIIGAFAFQAKDNAKKFNVNAFQKNTSGHCTILKGSVDCDTPPTDNPCTIVGVTGILYTSACDELYFQD
jgi:hypothetical protein